MSRKSTKCKSNQSANTSEDFSISQKDELPGVDYKNKQGPRSLRHNRLNLSTPEGESRFLHSVTKEISKKANIHKIQNAFQQQSSATASTALASKQVWCTNQEISVNFSCPLDDISTPTYIKKWKNSELINEIPVGSGEEDPDQVGASAKEVHARPSVITVNMKWKNGIQVKQCHAFTTRTRQLEPIMRKTDFDYETKTKFSKDVEATCERLFPDWRQKLMVLDGNDSHGMFSSSSAGGGGGSLTSAKTARSDKLKEEESPSITPYTGGNGDPYTREWKEYTDLEEHRILVIPSYSRNGFDMDLSKHYQFPYQAKFVIGRRAYHHKFMIRVPLSKSPQHFGLIFTFSEDPKGHSKLRIKSLLTVYSICPQTPKYACLETYEVDEEVAAANEDLHSPQTRSKSTQSTREAKKAVQLLSDNLKEEKVTSGCMNTYELRRELPQPGESRFRYHKLYDDATFPGKKQKKKQQMQRNIKMEQARC